MLFTSDKMWFTADQHFFHKNMYKEDFFASGFKRPWRTEAEGRKNIIERHNSLVKKDDWVIHGGDFAFTSNLMVDRLRPILEKLNGRHILVLGNHDEIKTQKYIDIGFTITTTSVIMELDNFKIIVIHDSSKVFYLNINLSEYYILCGHVHTHFKILPDKKIINIGVDQWNYYPINFNKILNELNKCQEKN